MANKPTKTKSKNQITTQRKHQMLATLEKLEDQLDDDIQELQPNERVKLWTQLQEYFVPKLSKVEAEVNKTKTIDVTEFAEQSGQIIEDAKIEEEENVEGSSED